MNYVHVVIDITFAESHVPRSNLRNTNVVMSIFEIRGHDA